MSNIIGIKETTNRGVVFNRVRVKASKSVFLL